MRVIFAALLSALLLIGFATGASAQNGLERFEKEIKPQFELKKFSYAGAQPLGASGFVLNDVVAVMPANAATGDKESTVKIDKVTVEELDFDRLKKDTKDDLAPRFAKLKLEGMTGDDEMFTALEPYGVPKVPFDIALDYRIDPAAKVLTLNMLEVTPARPGALRAVDGPRRGERQDRHGHGQGRGPAAQRLLHDRRQGTAGQAASRRPPRKRASSRRRSIDDGARCAGRLLAGARAARR